MDGMGWARSTVCSLFWAILYFTLTPAHRRQEIGCRCEEGVLDIGAVYGAQLAKVFSDGFCFLYNA